MKMLNSKVHGVIDYVVDIVFLLAPTVLGLSPLATTICYTVAGVHFLTSLCTQYELSLVKLIPFPVHGGIEFGAAIALVLMPWLAGISEEIYARNFFIASGVAIFGVWLTTDYHSTSKVGVTTRFDEFRRTG